MSKPIVLITGVTGYIGSHVALQFLQQSDKYSVRGSVRNPASEKSNATLKEALGVELFGKLELVPLELQTPEQFEAAVKGVTYVVHVASPFPTTNPDDENLVIKPALEGTLNMLKVCAAEPSVKRVCVTSSNYASFLIDLEDRENYPKEIDESCWSDETLPYLDPYQKSKIIAEKEAWKYWESLPKDSRFDMTTVLPGYVMGPPLASGMVGNSLNFCVGVLTGQSPVVPRVGFPAVDVRDVAKAHVLAVTKDEAQGMRYCLCGETQRLLDLAKKASSAVGNGYGLSPTQEMDDETGQKAIGPFWDLFPVYKKPDRATEILGLTYTPIATSMADMANTLIDKSYVDDKQVPSSKQRATTKIDP